MLGSALSLINSGMTLVSRVTLEAHQGDCRNKLQNRLHGFSAQKAAFERISGRATFLSLGAVTVSSHSGADCYVHRMPSARLVRHGCVSMIRRHLKIVPSPI